MIEANWQCDYGREGRELWRKMLAPYDAEIGTRSVALLARDPLPGNRYRPQVSDLRPHLRRLSHDAREATLKGLPAGGRIAPPDWVLRWKAARAADDRRVFPEQIPGYKELQAFEPANAHAYVLPATPTSDATDWVQPYEYDEAVA